MWSRSSMYSARNSLTHSCEPVSAAMAAFCTMLVAFEVDCDCSLLRLAMMGLGPSAKPARQPVMA